MNAADLTAWGRKAVEAGRVMARLHLGRGDSFRLFAGDNPVTLDLDADTAAVTACELCGVVPEPWFLGEVIASPVVEG